MEYATGKLLYCHSPPTFDGETFQRETLTLSLQKTKKLRDKLFEVSGTRIIVPGVDNEPQIDDQDIADDDMLLDLLGGMSTSSTTNDKVNNGQSKRQQKWGKKGRKGRNKDPYGCHTTVDSSLGGGNEGNVGVSVSGGKKHKRKNYTRATGYGSARAFQ
mmetsp:Transcript_3801/g.8302  ORF Transcript_3801/g.8302 Transcript_3801/m.8302 type:complete len:159 (+) Transcript_3801:3-479(+)